MRNYKQLSGVERALQSFKTVDLQVQNRQKLYHCGS